MYKLFNYYINLEIYHNKNFNSYNNNYKDIRDTLIVYKIYV